jgi:hypothetical protein
MSVLRLIPKVRHTAAFVGFERRDDDRHLLGINRDRAPASTAAASRGGKTGANPLLDQRAL